MGKIITKIRSFFTKTPSSRLEWNVADFKLAERWAKSQPDPRGEFSNLWKRIYSPRKDSVDILDEINILIGCK